MSDSCSFSLNHYENCLKLAKEKGYKFMTMKEYAAEKGNTKDDEKIIVLRHDIDLDLKLALNFAKIEDKHGINSTYFIRIHGKYNPINLENYEVIKKIIEMGHEIGLHYDCDFASLFDEDNDDFLKRDITIFERMTGTKMDGLSSHEPSRSFANITDEDLKKFGLKYQAYSETFLKELKYISDSSCRWREGCMHEWIEKEEPKLCILTHPFWWFDRSPLENWC